jgi:hypothetical protein
VVAVLEEEAEAVRRRIWEEARRVDVVDAAAVAAVIIDQHTEAGKRR